MKKIEHPILIIGCILLIVIYACVFDTYPTDSEKRILNIKDLSPICQQVVKAHNFNKVRYCDERPFISKANKITIVDITFGEANDCPEGCVYSWYRSVIDEGKEYIVCYDFLDGYGYKNWTVLFKIPPPYIKVFYLGESFINTALSPCDGLISFYNLFPNESFCHSIHVEYYKQRCLGKFGNI